MYSIEYILLRGFYIFSLRVCRDIDFVQAQVEIIPVGDAERTTFVMRIYASLNVMLRPDKCQIKEYCFCILFL